MRVLAFLPEDSLSALALALGGAHRITTGVDIGVALETLRHHKDRSLVVDPGMLDDRGFELLRAAFRTHRLPVLLYAKVTQNSAHRIVLAERSGAQELLIRGADDSPELIAAKLKAVQQPSAPVLLLSRIAERLERLPMGLQAATVPFFGGMSVPRWVEDFARHAGFGRRSLDRWMYKAGLRGTAALLDAARLARVWEPLVERGRPLDDVSRQFGYRRERVLKTHIRRLLGVTPGQLADQYAREQYTREQFAAQLADGLVRR